MSSPEGSTVTFRRLTAEVRPRAIENFARKLQREVAKGSHFECLITGNAELRRLNREFRGKDCATDVLSFPARPNIHRGDAESTEARGEEANQSQNLRARSGRRKRGLAPGGSYVGDIAISLGRARAQGRLFGHSTEQEIRILMLHGLLHLLGMDHESDGGSMARAERRWRARLELPNGLIERSLS